MTADRKKDWAASIFLFLMGFVLTVSFYREPSLVTYYGKDSDGRQQIAFLYPMWDAVVHHGEYPMWNPYFGGGVPWAGYIYDVGLSFIAPLVIAFGPVLGFKVWVSACYSFGAIGMYFAGRMWAGLAREWAVFAALAYLCTRWMSGQLASGNFSMMAMFLAPLFLACHWGLLHRRWYGWLLPLLYLTSLAMAKYAPLVMIFLLAVFTLWWAGCSRRRLCHGFTLWGLTVAAAFLLCLPKLLCLYDLQQRDLVDQTAYSALKSYRSWGELLTYIVATFDYKLLTPSMYIGVGLFVLALAPMGWALEFRRCVPFLAAGLVAVAFTFGKQSPGGVPLVFRVIPIMNTMNSPTKYWSVLIAMGLCVSAALALEHFSRRLVASARPAWQRRLTLGMPVVAVGLLLGHSFVQSVEDHGRIFESRLKTLEREPFHHLAVKSLIGVNDRYRTVRGEDRLPETDLLQGISHGIGNLTWYGNIVLPEHAVPKYLVDAGVKLPNPDYRGEIETLAGTADRAPSIANMTYNTLRIAHDAGDATTIILNFNHDPDWTADQGEVVNEGGRLALRLPAGPAGETTLRYHRTPFLRGMWGFAAGMLLWFLGMPFLAPRLQRYWSRPA